jgi:glycosyltransferase involved in cell wall biosynthesis
MVSVLILTKNEQQDLPGCLKTVAWSDDIHVYDSMSTDKTVEIARAFGAKVTRREFDNWSAHQNWGLKNIGFKYRWVLYIDADERVTSELAEGIVSAVKEPREDVAFRIRRRDFLGDTWLRHVQATSYYIRLFQPERMRYERLVNPVSIVDGQVGDLEGFLDHYPFSKGLGHWIERHNSYSLLEAKQIVSHRGAKRNIEVFRGLLSSDFTVRRYCQKELFYRLPLRPLLKFFVLYIGKRGFLDGRAGLTYAVLQAMYEYLIVLKTRELELHLHEK